MQMGCKLAGEGDRLLTAPLAWEKKYVSEEGEEIFHFSVSVSER